MAKQPSIGEVMTRFAITVEIDAPVREAEDLMFDNEVRHLVVVDGGELVGVVSDRDLAFVDDRPDDGLRDQLRVRSVCTLDVYAVPPEAPLADVLAHMAEEHIGSAVVAEGTRAVGIFTVTDACRCFAEHLRAG